MLSQCFETKDLLPVKDPLDMYLMHAMLGFAIFNQVCLFRLSCNVYAEMYHVEPRSRRDGEISLHI